MMGVSEQFRLVLEGMDLKALPLHQPLLKAYAFNMYGKPSLLIQVDSSFDSPVDGTKGIAVTVDPANAPNRYLRFQSEAHGFGLMFEAVVTSILGSSATAKSSDQALDRLLASFEEFRVMFASRSGRLGESAIRGLFAELLMLLELRSAGWSALAAITAWQGPYRVAKDFVLPGKRCIEVKSMRRTNHRVRIASVEQLDPRDEDLRLAVVVLEKSTPADGRQLLDLIAELREWMSQDPGALVQFSQALSVLGIQLDDAYYEQWAFEADEWHWFAVDDNFPRIHSDSVPAAVSHVSFSLDTDKIRDSATAAFWSEAL